VDLQRKEGRSENPCEVQCVWEECITKCIVSVCATFYISTSPHLRSSSISLHLHIFPSLHLSISPSPHLLNSASPHLHSSLSFSTSPHLLISHLLFFPSPHLLHLTSPHILISSSLLYSFKHSLISSSPHFLITSSLLYSFNHSLISSSPPLFNFPSPHLLPHPLCPPDTLNVMHCHQINRQRACTHSALRVSSLRSSLHETHLLAHWCSPRNRRRSISLEPVQCARPPSTIRIVIEPSRRHVHTRRMTCSPGQVGKREEGRSG
jgi:hypothetical protein